MTSSPRSQSSRDAVRAPGPRFLLGPGPARPRPVGRARWWLWLLPLAAITMLLTVLPALESVRLSAYAWKGYGEAKWVGPKNYLRMFEDPVVWTAFGNTIFFAVVTTIGTVAVGALLAIIINRKLPFGRLFTALIFLPVILPVVFTGLVWVFNLDTNFGWVNATLKTINPDLAQGWLSDPALVMWTISITTIFQFAGFPMIIVLAGLQDVPQEVQEAATLDGVNARQRVFLIVLPLIKDVLSGVALLQLLAGFRVFDQVYVMTRGGPGTSSQVMSTLVYREAFQQQHFGMGAAAAVITCVLAILVSMLYMSVFRTGKISRT